MARGSRNRTKRPNTPQNRAVLHLLTGSVFGGAEEHALSILTAIGAYGFEPCLAAPGEAHRRDAAEPFRRRASNACRFSFRRGLT